jgi:hypothetical protein
MTRSIASRAVRLLAVTAVVAGVAACERTPTGEDHAEVAAVRLTVGAQSVTVNAAGTQTGALTLAQGTHAVVVSYLDVGGDPVDEVEEDLSLQIVTVGGTTGVTFAANGLFAGTLSATSAGQKTLSVRLMHGDHPDFAQNVVITVQ